MKIKNIKLNNYQKVILTWGVLVLLGHILSKIFYENKLVLLVVWTVILSTALFVQVALMWTEKQRDYITHCLWLLVGIIGSFLTYVILMRNVFDWILVSSMWFFLCAVSMILTAYFQRNQSYILLAIFYLLTALMFQFLIGKDEIILSGIMFLFLSIIDSMLEYSSLRYGIAEFTTPKEPMTFKELRKIQKKENRFDD